MLDRIKAMFDAWEKRPPGPEHRDTLHLAAAVLLVEAARMDDRIAPEERARIAALVRERFGLSADEAADLLATAESQARGVAPHFNYVSVVVERCPPEQRLWLIDMLWEVVYADGELTALESNLLRRIGGLLHVSDVEVGEARKRVLKRLGLPEGTGVWE
ncbi:TerB family tellurite resistance protein [Azospirillum sp.]|uniref:tellurite resistance TerB family protein n=1 Tax=Azospirillum sp. TaxID=34012 RepID=UPI003D7510B2